MEHSYVLGGWKKKKNVKVYLLTAINSQEHLERNTGNMRTQGNWGGSRTGKPVTWSLKQMFQLVMRSWNFPNTVILLGRGQTTSTCTVHLLMILMIICWFVLTDWSWEIAEEHTCCFMEWTLDPPNGVTWWKMEIKQNKTIPGMEKKPLLSCVTEFGLIFYIFPERSYHRIVYVCQRRPS